MGWKSSARKDPDHQNLFPVSLKSWTPSQACSESADRVHCGYSGECVCVYKLQFKYMWVGTRVHRVLQIQTTELAVFLFLSMSLPTLKLNLLWINLAVSLVLVGFLTQLGVEKFSLSWVCLLCGFQSTMCVPAVPPRWGKISSPQTEENRQQHQVVLLFVETAFVVLRAFPGTE